MNVIKQKRKELGISQRELSEKLGTSQQTISRIEKSDVENIPSSLLIKLADIFQIPVDFLIRGDKSDLLPRRERKCGKYISSWMKKIEPL